MKINNETNVNNINYIKFMESENEKQKTSPKEREARQRENLSK